MVVMLLSAMSFVSCGSDDPEDEPVVDYASKVAGKYSGQLKYGDEIVEDVYVVSIEKLTSNTVSMEANFLDEKINFSIEKSGSQYLLKNSNHVSITSVVSGKSLTINYLTVGGYMFTYIGVKD